MIVVDVLSALDWSQYAKTAHAVVFGTLFPPEKQRIDHVLVAREGDKLMGYVTCREMDSETIYWQYGGAFPGTKDTLSAWRGYQAMVDLCKGSVYKRITTLIENDNSPMLKMAMKVGFKIQGVRTHLTPEKTYILLEHVLELK